MSSVITLASCSFTVMVMLVCTAGKGRGRKIHASNHSTVTMAPQSWYGVLSTNIQSISGVGTWLHTFNKFIKYMVILHFIFSHDAVI